MKKIVIGIDIGGTNTAFGLVCDEGKIYGQGRLSTQQHPDVDRYQEELFLGIQQLLRLVEFEYEIIGVGIGAPNSNYYKGTIEYPANLPWPGVTPFVEKFKRFFPALPVVMTNDANAAALGEKIYGAAKNLNNFVVITLGTGLGSGFVINGELLLGHYGFAGELGHVIINHTGRVCGCGRKGCLETYVSATGIKRTVFKLLADKMGPSEFRYISYNDLTAEMITNAALNGDPLAIEAYEYTGEQLGRALANAVLITEPEAIFLFGGLTKAGPYIFEPTKRYMEQYMMTQFRNKVDVLPSGIEQGNAAILGAAALIWNEMLRAGA
ncbi:MAG: ROK family protein [Rikenellaceae bacterium]|nr:ROK family protein [Rikenellaceae bacterium]